MISSPAKSHAALLARVSREMVPDDLAVWLKSQRRVGRYLEEDERLLHELQRLIERSRPKPVTWHLVEGTFLIDWMEVQSPTPVFAFSGGFGQLTATYHRRIALSWTDGLLRDSPVDFSVGIQPLPDHLMNVGITIPSRWHWRASMSMSEFLEAPTRYLTRIDGVCRQHLVEELTELMSG